MPEFIKGLDLCEGFFQEHARPILEENFPNLRYTAGLLGYGSDVLGYDDAVSTDHMWGPRFYLFLSETDIGKQADILKTFTSRLPYTYKGYSVHFSLPDPYDGGVRHPEFITSGEVSPLLWIQTPQDFVSHYLGRLPQSYSDWLAVSEHRLLGFTSGRLFVDMLDLQGLRSRLDRYPKEIRLYLIASQWALLSEEQAFVKRCGVRGDETGSRIICARMTERLMRLCFLYENQYAPYSKWFGTAFAFLPVNPQIGEEIRLALSADDIGQREKHLLQAQILVAELHNEKSITPVVSTASRPYFGRDIQVIYADKIAETVQKQIADDRLRRMPLFGSFSQIGNYVALSDNPDYQAAISALYEKLSTQQVKSSE